MTRLQPRHYDRRYLVVSLRPVSPDFQTMNSLGSPLGGPSHQSDGHRHVGARLHALPSGLAAWGRRGQMIVAEPKGILALAAEEVLVEPYETAALPEDVPQGQRGLAHPLIRVR